MRSTAATAVRPFGVDEMAHAMKYIIVAILALLIGGGLEFERGNREIKLAYAQLGGAYGCGVLAGTKSAIKMLSPQTEQLPEMPWCADFRDMWEKKSP